MTPLTIRTGGAQPICTQVSYTVICSLVLFCASASPSEAQIAKLFVPNYFDRTVSVLDANTLAPIGPPIALQPKITDNCPAAELLDDNGETVLDALGDPLPASYGAGQPDDVVLNAAGSYAFVTLDGCDQLAVINVRTHAVVRYVLGVPGSGETQIFRAPVDPLGMNRELFYVTNCVLPHIGVIDATNPRLAEQVSTIEITDSYGGIYDFEISPDGTVAYATDYPDFGCSRSPGIYPIDLVSGVQMGPIATSISLIELAIAANGRTAIGSTNTDTILIVDLTSGLETSISCGEGCRSRDLAFNADGSRLFVLDAETDDLLVYNTTDPRHPIFVTRTAISSANPDVESVNLFISGTRLFAALLDLDSSGEIASFDITNPDAPVQQAVNGVAGIGGMEVGGWWVPPPPTASGSVGGGTICHYGRLSGLLAGCGESPKRLQAQ